ncbi:hypothetical protein [Streptomyces nanshensis]|uniref:Uncharacterized protein n=1 Tax=Streptomyces nanshensis TaxID=518642 RepID=A0A1E7KZB4_9ACTN|nr:hypothetical protein [Streptomyces nanshensis]OEV09270.1 hypothetical protein AN218_22725 [Streptomyces nanshensis]
MQQKEHTVAIPQADEGAVRSWRKWLQGLEESKPGGMAAVGSWLEAGASYVLPVGALVVLCDPQPDGEKKRVRIWRVKRDGAFKEERDSTLGSANAFGVSVRGTMRRLLEKHPADRHAIPRQLTAAPPRPNAKDDQCERCRQPVAAGEGRLVRASSGYSVAAHHPGQCSPPPVRPNLYAGPCSQCGGWLESEEGILERRRPRHNGPCPPAEERRPAQSRANERQQDCERCGNPVPPLEGLLLRSEPVWIVRHRDGACPPREELWEIDRGAPGRFHPRPERCMPAGTVLRTRLLEPPDQPFPADAPGYRRTGGREVSAVVTTVREKTPVYCRDADGDNPGVLVGEDGWYFRILVRPATAEEAADILAREETAARRAELEERRRRLFLHPHVQDGELPEQPDLSSTTLVNFGERERRSILQTWPEDELRVDEARGVVWFIEYNGHDGDDWSRNNITSFIARRFPLSEERRALLTALRAEYEQPGT